MTIQKLCVRGDHPIFFICQYLQKVLFHGLAAAIPHSSRPAIQNISSEPAIPTVSSRPKSNISTTEPMITAEPYTEEEYTGSTWYPGLECAKGFLPRPDYCDYY